MNELFHNRSYATLGSLRPPLHFVMFVKLFVMFKDDLTIRM